MNPTLKVDVDNDVAVLVMSRDEAGILRALLGKCPGGDMRSEPLYQALLNKEHNLPKHRCSTSVTIEYEPDPHV